MLPIKLVLVRICNFAGNELRLRFWTILLNVFDIAKMITLETILLESPNFLNEKKVRFFFFFFLFLRENTSL